MGSALKIQNYWKGYKQRQDFLRIRRNIVKIQAQIRMKLAINAYQNKLAQRKHGAIIIQKHVRKVIAKKNYDIKIKAIVVIQSYIRSFIAKKLKKFLKEDKSAIIIQKWFRGCAQRKKFKMEMRSIITIQKFARGFLVRKSLEEQRNSVLKIQNYWKGYKQRQDFLRIRRNIVKIQAQIRM